MGAMKNKIIIAMDDAGDGLASEPTIESAIHLTKSLKVQSFWEHIKLLIKGRIK